MDEAGAGKKITALALAPKEANGAFDIGA